jgi:signal transduction histidine kinase
VGEGLLVVATAALGQFDVWAQPGSGPYHGPRALSAVLALGAAATIAWRTRAPLHALGTAIVLVAGTRLAFAHDTSFAEGFLPIVVLTASAAYYRPGRPALGALGAAEVALLVIVLVEPSIGGVGTFLVDSLFLVVPWTAARALRHRADRADTLAGDLDRLREEQRAHEAAVLAEERARIARELHDVVAHGVSVMVLNTGAARLQLEASEQAHEQLLTVERAGREALAELRRMLGLLRTGPHGELSAAGPAPGLDRIDELVANVHGNGLAVTLERNGDAARVPAGLGVSAYRIVQEALTNVVKHAGPAATAVVRIDCGPDALDLEVLDDGSGIARSDLPSAGHGILGARERSLLFGGWADAGPRPEGGWRLRAHLPLDGTVAAR